MAIRKDRLAGAPRQVALLNFNGITREYADEYTLGRVKGGTKWEGLGAGEAPQWAVHHRPLVQGVSSPQAEILHAATQERYP
jgi:hypothetical protein